MTRKKSAPPPTYARYARMQAACNICGEYGPVDVDHDHTTGDIRGLLCRVCNITIRNHSAEYLRRAADYVEAPPIPPGAKYDAWYAVSHRARANTARLVAKER